MDQEPNILLHELPEAVESLDGRLEFSHLFGGDIAGDIATVFIALVVVVGPRGALADDAEGSPIEGMEGGDFPEDGLGSGGLGGIHEASICATHILRQQKKGEKPLQEISVLHPVTGWP